MQIQSTMRCRLTDRRAKRRKEILGAKIQELTSPVWRTRPSLRSGLGVAWCTNAGGRLDAEFEMLDAGCCVLNAECWMLNAGCSMLDIIKSSTYQLSNSATHQPINSWTHQRINSSTELINSLTHRPVNLRHVSSDRWISFWSMFKRTKMLK